MDQDQTNETVMQGLMGRSLVDWHIGDGGMHFALDDGRVVIFSGAFVIAVMKAEQSTLH